MVARDTVVARRIAERVAGRRALVIAGDHEYGVQLDGQLALAGLQRVDDAADVIVLAGLVGEAEADEARALAPLPIIAFDGIQGESFPDQEVELALVYAPGPAGVAEARRAAEMVVAATRPRGDAQARGFDEYGDPLDPRRQVRALRGVALHDPERERLRARAGRGLRRGAALGEQAGHRLGGDRPRHVEALREIAAELLQAAPRLV